MKDKVKSDKSLSSVITMLLLIFLVSILSLIFEKISLDGNVTSIVNGKLETSIIVAKNILSKDGFIYIFSNFTNNFNMLEQLVLIIIGLFSVSILDASGVLKHIFSPLKRVKTKYITFLIVFIGIISTIILDYSYILLIPLVSVMYKYINRNPVLGVITMFIGITLGYGTGVMYNYSDYLLGVLTQLSANVEVDPSYTYGVYSTLYIMLASTVLISSLITFLIEKYISKKIPMYEYVEDEIKTSKKAFTFSTITFILLIVGIVFMVLPNGILLDNTQSIYMAKLFSGNSPFYLSFMYILLIIFSIVGLVYGFISKNFENSHDFTSGFNKQFSDVGHLFMLLFLSSVLISIIDWTNIGTILVCKVMDLIALLDFSGIPLIVVTFILICLISIVVPNSLEKWTLMSPTLIPIFMRANITPDFTQYLFKVADSVGKCITPLFVYLIITIGFVQKFNKDNRISLFSVFKYIIPIIITMILFWIILLTIWYMSGLPLGIGAYATM